MSASKRVVVITGGSGGIGRALCDLLAHSGGKYRVCLAARREPQLQEAVEAFTRTPGNTADDACYVVADVTRRADVDRVAAQALAKFQRIDVWVNNAGTGNNKNVTELQDEDIEAMMRANVYSALYGMQVAVKAFEAQAAQSGKETAATGVVVNVSSILGRNAAVAPARAAYSASKHFLNGLSDALRAELQAAPATKGIRIATVSPGPVATDFGLNAGSADSRENPAAQPVDEVAAVVQQAIDDPTVEEAYTRPDHKKWMDAFITAKGAPSSPVAPLS